MNTAKTPADMRQVPMLEFVKEAFLMEKERQELLELHCEATVDGYTDFIVINRFGSIKQSAASYGTVTTSNFWKVIIRRFCFPILAVILSDIHLPQECVKPE